MYSPEERLRIPNSRVRDHSSRSYSNHRTPEENLVSNMRREMIFESERSSRPSQSSQSSRSSRPSERSSESLYSSESSRSSRPSESSRSSRSDFDRQRTKNKAREIFDSEKPRPAVVIGGGGSGTPFLIGGGVPQVVGGGSGTPVVIRGGVPQVVGGMPIGQAIPIVNSNGITFLTPQAPIAVIQPRIIAPARPQIILGAAPFPVMFNGIRLR